MASPVPQVGLGVRWQKHLSEWVVVNLPFLVSLQMTLAAHPFIYSTSFSRRSYYPLQLPLPETDFCTGIQARATGTAVQANLAVVGEQWLAPLCWASPVPIGEWSLQHPTWAEGDLRYEGEHGEKWCLLFPFPHYGSTVLELTARKPLFAMTELVCDILPDHGTR